MKRREFLYTVGSAALAQDAPPVPFVCPMDPDVRSAGPSKCPKCGMALVAGIPSPREFHLDLRVTPKAPKPGDKLRMRFRILDPDSGNPAKLLVIHEKLFHLFLVSQDLTYFAHEHPELQPDGSFLFETSLPDPGEYRVLSDFYPEGAMPQMLARSIILPGAAPAISMGPDLQPKQGDNLAASLRLDPVRPLAGKKTMLFFQLDPVGELEQYLGAWGHLLAASADLIDMLHAHPAWEEAGPAVQFNVIFPRPGLYRVWVQMQRRGVVNTFAFTIPVHAI